MKIKAAVLAGVMAMGLLGATGTSAEAKLTKTGNKCASLVVVGARGSGEGQSAGSIPGFGSRLSPGVSNMASRIKRSGTIRYLAVKYPAIKITPTNALNRKKYFASVGAGAKDAMSKVNSLASACPSTRFALVGYSQGASVMRWAMRDLAASRQDKVVLVGLLGDPERRGFDTRPSEIGLLENYGTGTLRRGGVLGAGPALPARRARAVVTMCHAGDAFCNSAPTQLVRSPIHYNFYQSKTGASKTGMALYIPLANYGGFR